MTRPRPHLGPGRWVLAAALVLVLLTVSVVGGAYAGHLVDGFLTAQLGELESRVTGWVVLLTVVLCSWSRWRHRAPRDDP